MDELDKLRHIILKMGKDECSAVTPNQFLGHFKITEKFHFLLNHELRVIKAVIIAIVHISILKLVGLPRFELGTYGLKVRCDTVSP